MWILTLETKRACFFVLLQAEGPPTPADWLNDSISGVWGNEKNAALRTQYEALLKGECRTNENICCILRPERVLVNDRWHLPLAALSFIITSSETKTDDSNYFAVLRFLESRRW
jgi:hypothetical protein